MPRDSWNEIENRAEQFAAQWAGETYEKGESQTFWSEFLSIFGIDRRRHGAFFEYAIKKTGNKQGFIDLFWPGKLLAEQKSAGRDLTAAEFQAFDYLPAMPDYDLPHAIVVSDFATFQIRNLDTNAVANFPLEKLPANVRRFAFLIEDSTRVPDEEKPVNRLAAERMAALHNQLEANRYTGRDLELLLTRIVFCLFADDARIFEHNTFANFLRNRTRDDGSDTGPFLVQIFEVLNTPEDERQTTLDADLQRFPYINGGLFADRIRTPGFTGDMRHALLTAALVDWREVSPAIFGSMFQGVMDAEHRRNLGAHYTSEKNILRVIQPLFLDDLYAEFETARRSRRALEAFHRKLATLRFLDPACGSGNFLVITYRELRRLEHKVVQELTRGQQILDLGSYLRVNVDQMYGIEIDEFASRVAQTALWLTDHQLNLEASKLLGQTYTRLPLTSSPHIVHANALRIDWGDIVAPEDLSFMLGNPPFVGKHYQSKEQKVELAAIFPGVRGAGSLDFVAAWYGKALEVLQQNPRVQAALVSTNSITQGEQAIALWSHLLSNGVKINFGHRTFRWSNDARGVAAVHCVIVGFALFDAPDKRLFDYPDIKGQPIENRVSTINSYLVGAPSILIAPRRNVIYAEAPAMIAGGKPVDGGNLLMTTDEKQELIAKEPRAEKWIRPFTMGVEFINGIERWCLWLQGISPVELRSMPAVLKRVERVREMRLGSSKPATRELAAVPHLFGELRISQDNYLAVPSVSSERRHYIPIGYLPPEVIPGNMVYFVPNASLWDFGVMMSNMHMAWVRTVCGRLKSDYRYTNTLVYNNFPWPENVSDAQRAQIESLAQGVLDARALYPDSSLADLYDPLTMPKELADAHHKLDRAVDRLYQRKPFDSDADRVALLFNRYQELTEV